MFQKVMSLIAGAVDIAPPKDTFSFPMTALENAVQGATYKFNGGRLTLASADDPNVAVICLENAAGAADDADGRATVWVRGSVVLPGAVYLAPITAQDGTALATAGDIAASFVIGAQVNINATGLGVDGETGATDGPLTVLRVDATNLVCWVLFNVCAAAMGAPAAGVP